MTNKATQTILTLSFAIFLSCNTDKQENKKVKEELPDSAANALHPDTVSLKETFDEEDAVYNEYLADRLKPIRKNFKRINSISKWTSVINKELWETTEGGEATFYYLDGILEKIITRQFGETFQQLTEYYLLSGQLSFVFEKSYRYNRPIYYDSASMKENNDNQAFDLEKSEIVEDRSYFEKEKLIHQVNNQDGGSPFTEGYLFGEQKRLKTEFDRLIKLMAEK